MPQVISVVNQKGGVGKTTTAINVSHNFSKIGKRTLLVDFDPQSNVADWLGINLTPNTLQIINCLLFEDSPFPPVTDIEQLIQTKYGFDIIPTKESLKQADNMSRGMVGRERLLKQSLFNLKGIDKYDYIIIDCPPAPGFLNNTAIFAADWLLITIQAEYLPLKAFAGVLNTIKMIEREYKDDFKAKIVGILQTMANENLNLTKNISQILEERFTDKVFETSIRRNVSLAEAPGNQKPIGEYKPGSHGDEDYSNLTNELLERLI